MHQSRQAHWDAELRGLRYIKTTLIRGLLLRTNSDWQLRPYYDSNWVSYAITRHSLKSFFVSLEHSPISQKSKKQCTASRSSAEAEYRSIGVTCCELKWLRCLLHDRWFPQLQPITLFCDN